MYRVIVWILLALPLLGAKSPAPGIAIPHKDQVALDNETKALKSKINTLGNNPLLADVIIFHNAVRYALDDDMFYKKEDVESAHKLLKLGHERANQLRHWIFIKHATWRVVWLRGGSSRKTTPKHPQSIEKI